MLKVLNEEDYCPHCEDKVLYMGEADFGFALVKFNCPDCDYFEVRQVKTVNK